MYDFHSHILPGMDDGSRDIRTSAAMIEQSFAQGIKGIALTPHFYADDEDPDKFLKRRADSYNRLMDGLRSRAGEQIVERFILGSEVHYFTGIGRCDEVIRLSYGSKGNHILLEPPFSSWKHSFIRDVEDIISNYDMTVIIAHIERYLDQGRIVNELFEIPGVLIQSNAEAFLKRQTRRKVLKLMKKDRIQVLGSDSHNMTTRPPNLGNAEEYLNSKGYENYIRDIDSRCRSIWIKAGGII